MNEAGTWAALLIAAVNGFSFHRALRLGKRGIGAAHRHEKDVLFAVLFWLSIGPERRLPRSRRSWWGVSRSPARSPIAPG